MNETFEEFHQSLLEEVRENAAIRGCTPSEYFLEDTLDKLTSMDELFDPVIKPIKKRCYQNRIMAFDAYAFDDSDKSIVLIANAYTDVPSDASGALTMTEIDKYKYHMLNFLNEAYDGKLDQYFDATDELIKIGNDIARRLKIDYIKADNDDSLEKIKLYIVTNRPLSARVTTFKTDPWNGKQVELNIWSLRRFYDLAASGRDKEAIVISTEKYGLAKGIPCIKAQMSNALDYDAYLAIVPGEFLHAIYYDHGSRLLEGNVRAFLSFRGKINKGMRTTINKEPTKFFAYNNGIACTAKSVKLSPDGHCILQMEDLQIINGGQTTASLTDAKRKDLAPLDEIFVPMKLTIIKDDDQYDDMIRDISKYANSQNKVTDADMFSNHPFHRRFEELSKKILAPAHDDFTNDTNWYYERSRGKYEQEQFKLVKQSDVDDFKKKYPKNQVIKKEALAKYFTAAELQRPDIVSKGSQWCMKSFGNFIDNAYQNSPETINEVFFKKCVCYAILYKETDLMVARASWYQTGGYKLNIVPYTVSKLMSLIPGSKSLDFVLIWRNQELYPSLRSEIELIAIETNNFVQQSGGIIVTEYCKKLETWEKYKEQSHQLSLDFSKSLVSKELVREKERSSAKEEKLIDEASIQIEIVKLGGDYWRRLIAEGNKMGLLSDHDIQLLSKAASLDTANPKYPNPVEFKLIWKIRQKLEDGGVLI